MRELYGHPFSSYTWKAQIALLEKEIPFTPRMIDGQHPDHIATLREHWPLGKFPILLDRGRPVIESSIIIEYLDQEYPASRRLLPDNPQAALAVRFMDRIFDNHVMTPVQAVVNEYLINRETPDAARVKRAHGLLETIYAWLDERLDKDGWACGEEFTLADCVAAPSLFYADWVRPINPSLVRLRGYRTRLLARPSVARCIEEARPYRPLFPLGAPDRD
ncbi:glutathione S-transferase family protein [Pedomonas mirosovicensis]|uniref:glutathione S-transferase family protein n=1 Tax=Pedomonas mirosovicensis TaxID=2908641 RepID=UPI00216A9AE3|nr:glutathione S-transferase family protein [Pedomonas mirosovicensis]MCH8686689.1 glutathione S-transferase family protein [Pedomonas mirosovicensis]